jgi:hypothetical protein
VPNQIANRFTAPTPQTVSDLYDKIDHLTSLVTALSTPAPASTSASQSTTTTTEVVHATSILNATGLAANPQYALIPVLTSLPSNNPTQGLPYAQNELMVIVNNQFWEYRTSPIYAWSQVGTATVLLSDTAANLHNYSAVIYPGALFFESDTFLLLRSNGTNWIGVTGGVNEAAIAKAEWLTVTGTANAILGTTATAITALAAGMLFRLVPTATNTLSVTLAVDGLTAKAVTKNGTTALSGGELQSGQGYLVLYDGTQFQIVGISLPISALIVGSDNSGHPVAAALASGKIFIGSAGNLPVAQAVSGDGTLSSAGALAIKTVAGFTPVIEVGGSATSITFTFTATSVVVGSGTGAAVNVVINVTITGWPAVPSGTVTIGGLPVTAGAQAVGAFAAVSGFVGLSAGVSVIPVLSGATITLDTQGTTGLTALPATALGVGSVFTVSVAYQSA